MPVQGCFMPVSQLLGAAHSRDSEVCVDGDRRVTWSAFVRTLAAAARAVRERTGQRWLLHCEHPLDFTCALLAVLQAGRTAVVAPGLQPAMVDALRAAYDEIIGEGAPAAVELSRLEPTAFEPHAIEARTARIDLYTSGSSGEPKRVEKTLHQLETEARVLDAVWGASIGSLPVVATVPHHHIYGLLFRIIWPLSAGRAFDAGLCTDPELLRSALRRHGEAVLVSSPAHLVRLPELMPLADLRRYIRRIFSSGGPVPPATAAQYHNVLGAAPTEIYGSTESGGIGWREQDGSDDAAAWRPFPDISLRIEPDGALCLRSPYVPDENWLTMADAAELLPSGRFRLKGRLDRVVKVEGKRISLPELEQALRLHPSVREAAVVPLEGSKQLLGAVVVLRDAAPAREALVPALREFLLERFEPVLVPRRWRFVPRLPADERGKVTTATLRALFQKAEDAPAA